MKKTTTKTMFIAYAILLIMIITMIVISINTPTDREVWGINIESRQEQLDSIFTNDPGFFDCIENVYEYEKLQEARNVFYMTKEKDLMQDAYNNYRKYYDEIMVIYSNFKIELEY